MACLTRRRAFSVNSLFPCQLSADRAGTSILCLFMVLVLFLAVAGVADARRPVHAAKSKAEIAYSRARASYDRLSRSARLRTDRRAWIKVINEIRRVYLSWSHDPSVGPKSLYMLARCYRELYGYSRGRKDLNKAVELYSLILEKYPHSRFADDALYALGEIYLRTGRRGSARRVFTRLVTEYPKSDKASAARKRLKRMGVTVPAHKASGKRVASSKRSNRNNVDRLEAGRGSPGFQPAKSPRVARTSKPAIIRRIRYWSDPDYTRVVIDASRPVAFRQGSLPANRKRGLPRRFYLDLSPAYKSKTIKDRVKIQDGLLKSVRIAQFQPRTVRVVFDLGNTHKTRVFYLEGPFRIVVDAYGSEYARKTACRHEKKVIDTSGAIRTGSDLSLAQQLGLCVRRVVIDAGHGGKDPGAIGPTGLREKDVTLRLAKKVAEKLRKRLGCRVYLTRSSDKYIGLTQRTAIANSRKADIFISIHANAAKNRRLRGVETYFLNFALDEDAMRVAARENATSEKRIGELKNILNEIMKNTKVNESSRLATEVQNALVKTLRKKYGTVADLGVKQAPFFVLIGARMPSVLVETSFISNRVEERRLRSGRYLDRLADGIVRGVLAYAEGTRTAFLKK